MGGFLCEGPWKIIHSSTIGWTGVHCSRGTKSKYVTFYSKIQVNKSVQLPICFSTAFSDHEILHDRDLLTQIYNRWGTGITRPPHDYLIN